MNKILNKLLIATLGAVLICGCDIRTDAYIVNSTDDPGTIISSTVNLTTVFNNENSSLTLKVPKEQDISKPINPTKDGYIFYCWCKDEALTNEIKSWPISIKEDTTIYAKYRTPSDYVFSDVYIRFPSIILKYHTMLDLIDDYLYYGEPESYDFRYGNFLGKSYTKAFLDGYMYSYDLFKIIYGTEVSRMLLKFIQVSGSQIVEQDGKYSYKASDEEHDYLAFGIENEYVYLEGSSDALTEEWDSILYNKATVDYEPKIKISMNCLIDEVKIDISLDENNYVSYEFINEQVDAKYRFLNDIVGYKAGEIFYKRANDTLKVESEFYSLDVENINLFDIYEDYEIEDQFVKFYTYFETNINADLCKIFGNKEDSNKYVLMDHGTLVEEYDNIDEF